MTDDTLYERFECIDPPRHRKFYELEVEPAFFYPKRLIRRWGKIGSCRPRELRHLCATPDELRTVVTSLRQRRIRHGYQPVRIRRGARDPGRAAVTPG